MCLHLRIVFLLKSHTLTESVCESADWLTIVDEVLAPVL